MVRTITDVSFDEYFGFTDEEVKTMLAYYGLESHYDEIQKWYDGYLFGEKHVYCPWDVINYCSKLRVNPRVKPESFWANSSGNSIVRRLVDKATKQTKNEIELKYAEKAAFEDVCREAVNQIRERQYAQKLREEGLETIWAYGIACFKKRCKVVCERIL